MVRWDMAAQPRHVFHRIGMISIYRGQQHKRFCWFFQGSLSVPFQSPYQVMLFGCENRCCVYPMTLQECKGQSTLQRHLRQELICGEFQSPPPSSDVTNFFPKLWAAPKFYLKVWRIQLCVLWMWDVTRWPIVSMSDLSPVSIVIRSSSLPKSQS